MKKIYYKRNSVEHAVMQDTTTKNRLPKYDTCPNIAYLNDLIAFLDGDIDREHLTLNQPQTKGARRTTLKKEWKNYMELVQTKSLKHFYELLVSGEITLSYSNEQEKQIILDTSDRKLYEYTEEQKYHDYDITGYGSIYRAKVPFDIQPGDIFNIYLDESTKHGCEWLGTLDKSLNNHLNELENSNKNL